MSTGGSRSSPAAPDNWQHGQDYWIYQPTNVSDVPVNRSRNHRGRTRLYDERWVGGSDYGFTSRPSAVDPRRLSLRLLLFDDYPGSFVSPPTFYEPPQWSSEDESRLSPEEQKQALNKLRKQLYSPHMSNIIRRLGTKSGGGGSPHDDVGKRCAICLEDFETKQFLTVTPCNHMFHEECIVPWVKSQGKCPVCRFVIVGQNGPQRSSGNAAASPRGWIAL